MIRLLDGSSLVFFLFFLNIFTLIILGMFMIDTATQYLERKK